MCYSIPGKVVEIKNNIVSIEYFDSVKRARNDFEKLELGDYVYAQGGFVISKITAKEALKILEVWKELFKELDKQDLQLSQTGSTLTSKANHIRHKTIGNSCCVHGILEISNFCRNNCHYCGIRKDNKSIERYRMSDEKILASVDRAANEFGFKALVLQSGEDPDLINDVFADLIATIRNRFPVLIFLSIGEFPLKLYQKFYKAGARGVLLRFETSNPNIYAKSRPGFKLETRLKLISELKRIGYALITGSILGLPDASVEDHLNDIKCALSLNPEMYSFGPLIPAPTTPFENTKSPNPEMIIEHLARTRMMKEDSNIVVTTALETLDPKARKKALLSGANSLMLNVTPEKYKKLYSIYPKKYGYDKDLKIQIDETINLLHELGRAPTDLSL
ncbi:MAG: radical SAM protein [Pseudomonadota bacterium]